MRRISRWKWSIAAAMVALLVVSLVGLGTNLVGAASGRSTIPGHLVPRLQHAQPKRDTDGAHALNLSIALNLRDRAGLAALIAGQSDPRSPLYHQYLTPDQFKQRFSPTQASVDTVVQYLHDQGLTVQSVSPNNMLIDASGSVAAVQRAFAVHIKDFDVDGRTAHAPTDEPSVPNAMAGLIVSVSGLDDVGVYHPLNMRAPRAQTHPLPGPGGGFTPSELRTAYDMNSLISSADGTGQTVAIFELDGYKASDVNTYLSNYSLGSAKYSNVLVDGATNTAGAGAIEVELDMEDVSAIAPGATQKIYIGPNTTQGVNDTYNKIVTDNIAKVTSTSWGLCEASSGTAELQALDNIFQQGAAQGQAVFAASGDSGAYDCNDTNLAVDSPADDPNVVGVGGTNLQTGSGGTYTSESVWSCPTCSGRGPNGTGGGGGNSTFFSRPSYQTGTGVNTSAGAPRQVPDVSADADPATGYSVYCSVTAAGCSSSSPWISVGGTSAAAPLWAGVATDTNQYLSAHSQPVLGSASATIYRLFNTSQSFTAYHDITTGNNLFYNAAVGYDLASGIGTPDVWNLARDAAGGTVSNDFSISASPTSLSIVQGNSGTATISTAVTSGSAGTVNLTASVSPSGPTVSLNPTSVTAGGSSTLTVSVGSSVATGNYTVTVTGTEGSATHSTTVAVTVTAPVTNDFSISASPTSLSIVQGGSGTSTISTAVTSGSAGTVNLTAGVSPSGPTASLSPTSVTAGGSSTLTVSVGSSVATGSYTVTVTGTEGSATHSTSVAVTVTSSGGGGDITNGGFETGTFSGWTTGGQATSISSTAHSGSHSGQAGSTSPTNGDSTISQTFTVPSSGGTLGVWYQVHCPDTVTYDWATITLKDNTTNTTTTLLGKTCSNNGTWQKVSTSVTANDSVTLTLLSHDDNYATDPTYTLFDDVAISAPITNPVVNPGFETGTFSGWTTGGQATSISSTAHSGSHSGQAGSTSPTNGDSTISQTFTIPSGASTLGVWYRVVCPDTVTYDWATITLKDNTTNTTTTLLGKTCSNSGSWVQASTSVSGMVGHSVTLTLLSHDDNYATDPTYTLFDDVSVS